MRSRIIRAVVLSSIALVAMTGVSQASMVTGATSNNNSLSGTTAVALSGNYAFAPAYWSGQLNVFDVSNPYTNPRLVASTPSSPNMLAATNVTISGNFAFVTSKNRNGPCTPNPLVNDCSTSVNDDPGIANTGDSLTIVDISNPLAPTIVGTVRDPQKLFGAYTVAVDPSGNFAYVASEGLISGQPTTTSTSAGSFSVISLTGAGSPSIVANIDNSALPPAMTNGLQHATGVAISGSDAYVTSFYGHALTVIDISTPTAPVPVTSLVDGGNLNAPDDVQISGTNAYVVNQVAASLGASEFTVVNISNPAAPAVVGHLTDPMLAGAYRVRLHGNYAYVSSNNNAAIDAVNISNPAAPTLAGSVQDTTNLANVNGLDVAASGQYIVTASPRAAGGKIINFAPYPLPGSTGPNGAPIGTISIIAATTAITSTPPNPSTSTSATFAFTANDPAATFTCSLDGGAASPCTAAGGASYSSLSAGSHTFTVVGADSLGLTPAQASYTWTVVPANTPKNTVAPKITGNAQTGQTLTVSKGTWSNASTFTYAWARCAASGSTCTPIAGQISSSYQVSVSDLGSRLAALVTAHNGSVAGSATAGPTAVVTWSTGAYSGSLHGRSLALTVPSPGGGLKLTKLVISLPKGVSFAGSAKSLAGGFSVKAGSKKVKFKLSLSHGSVTLTFKTPPTRVTISVKARSISLSSALAKRVASHKVKSLSGGLSASYQGKPTRKGTVKYKVK